MPEIIPRVDIFRDRHIGFGVRWRVNGGFKLDVSVAFPFVTFIVGLGRRM